MVLYSTKNIKSWSIASIIILVIFYRVLLFEQQQNSGKIKICVLFIILHYCYSYIPVVLLRFK